VVPANVSTHIVTGLDPNGAYEVTTQAVNAGIQVDIRPIGQVQADSGGVLRWENR
jgi:hypothetical protein